MIYGKQNGVIAVYSLTEDIVEYEFNGHEQDITILTVSNNSERLISVEKDNVIKLWNLVNKDLEQVINTPTVGITGILAFYKHGGTEFRIFMMDHHDSVKILNPEKEEIEEEYSGVVGTIAQALIFGRGQHRLWPSGDGVYRALQTQPETDPPTSQLVTVHDKLRLNEDTRILCSSYDNTLKIWNSSNFVVEQTLSGHPGRINAALFADNGRKVISASSDCTLKIWDLQNNKEIASITLDNELTCIASREQPDGLLILVGDHAGTIYCLRYVE